MYVDVRKAESPSAAELYVHAIPSADQPVERQAKEVFAAVADVLRRHDARIVEERLFALDSAMETLRAARADAYGDLADDVPAAPLAVPKGMQGELSGVLVHAVGGGQAPQVLRWNGAACGRLLDVGGQRYVTLSAIRDPDAGDETDQARAMLEQGEAALRSVDADFHSVVRTWMWLGRILDWYEPFNEVRNRFFHERGLLNDDAGRRELPASTGIGVGPAGGGTCAMDVVAVVRGGEPPELLLRGGDQNPAYDYGSAFSRAARAVTPGGQTVYVSGTAAIDPQGRTQHVGDIGAQIEDTVQHVQAVLRDTACRDDEVVDSIIYCKTPEVEAQYRAAWADKLSWPQIIVQADVCRDELLFEVEAAAMPGSRRI